MPQTDDFYQDALDYFYESESEEEYFSASENPKSEKVRPGSPRVRRENAKREAKKKMMILQPFGESTLLPRLPVYIPPFNDRTVSAMSLQPEPKPKPEKRWRSASSVAEPVSHSRGEKGHSHGGLAKKGTESVLSPWSVDESEITNISVEGASWNKYREFKGCVEQNNCSPLDPRFEKRWDLKLTHQKKNVRLYSIRLSSSDRATFTIDSANRKVMIFSVKKHD